MNVTLYPKYVLHLTNTTIQYLLPSIVIFFGSLFISDAIRSSDNKLPKPVMRGPVNILQLNACL